MGDKRPAILLDEGVAHWCWSQGHIENVATAIALAITDERSTGRIYNFGEAEIPSMGEWLRKIGQAAAWNGEVVVVPKGRLPILAEFLRLREDVINVHRGGEKMLSTALALIRGGVEKVKKGVQADDLAFSVPKRRPLIVTSRIAQLGVDTLEENNFHVLCPSESRNSCFN